MANDVERTLASKLQYCKFSVLLDESTFCRSNILVTHVRYYCLSLKCFVDKFLSAKCFKGDAKGETIFSMLGGLFEETQCSPQQRITMMHKEWLAVTEDLPPSSRKMFLMYVLFTVFYTDTIL